MTTLSERLYANQTRSPEQVAVYLQDSRRPDFAITYRQLLRGGYAFARTYLREGLTPGEVIILILQHGEDLIYSFWGAILIGAVAFHYAVPDREVIPGEVSLRPCCSHLDYQTCGDRDLS